MNGLVTALRFLTIIPVPGKESEKISSSLPWFPVAGFVIGFIMYLIPAAFSFMHLPEWSAGISLMTVAAGIIITGGLHLDGLADWADSLGCSYNREKMLAVMKDSRIGSFGVIGLILILAGKMAAVNMLIYADDLTVLIAAPVISRTMTVYLCVRHSYTRPEGGVGKDIVEGSRLIHLVVALGISLLMVFIILSLAGFIFFVVGLTVSFLLGFWSKQKLGGITGDILGAGVELSETATLLIAAFMTAL